MTIADLEEAASLCGFRLEELLTQGEDWRIVDPVVFRQRRENYPSLRIQDLISTGVTVLFRKPQ